jgi:uncharacterized protein YcbK (DUF882 family)
MIQNDKKYIIGGLILLFLLMRKKVQAPKQTQSGNICPEPKSKYFKLSEFHSKDGVKVPEKYYCNVQELMNNLDVLRDELKTRIKINSGFRSVAHNKAVGGVSNSEHLYGKAADLNVLGVSTQKVKDTIEKLISAGKMKQGGVGLYNTFVHYDIRGKKSRWKIN